MEEEIFVKTLSKRSIFKLKVKTNDSINTIKNIVVDKLTLADQQEYMIFFNNEYKPLSSIEKLEDAKFAGTNKSHKCTLILTEGDSAKAFVMSGLSSIINGEDIYGVFPLKGKIPNIRRRSRLNDIINNEEIQSFITILGLRGKKENDIYKSGSNSLRYGHVMIMSDPDYDGSHFKGLVINLLYMLCPSLLKCPNFLSHLLTPIVKISKSGIKQSFYFHKQYETWEKECQDSSTWEISYYKGLSTNTSEEAVEYFQNIEEHKKSFIWKSEDDQAIELPFDPKNTSGRKDWIRNFKHENPKTYLQASTTSYADFIHSELILYSIANIQRRIPSLVDGFNKVQRKVIFSLFLREEIKLVKPTYVGNLIGYVSEHTCYHHNEVSIADAIIKMAQDHMNSNNINLLLPLGHFGSSKLQGKDHAAYRYIRTQLNCITRYIFLKDDDMFLDYLNEDGVSVEPYCYRPIIPMILVNGCVAMSVGWISYIPKYHPMRIIRNIKSWLKDRTMKQLVPWYKGFRDKKSFLVNGKVEITGLNSFEIQEIPFTRWSTETYKKFLTSLTKGPRGETPRIKVNDLNK
ncbi:DNA topoisomerase 2-like [Vicia villosa]|uniref:DNA topoisomerase 2-like n=1 Tax=Vicia villosa TaxID=3911 RepID=UPI00273BDCEC|nr:DNA topoisomerase 2-like [Vicia villosa]